MLHSNNKSYHNFLDNPQFKSSKTIKTKNIFHSNSENLSFDSPIKKNTNLQNRKVFTQLRTQKCSFESPLGTKNLNSIVVNSNFKNKGNNQNPYYLRFKKCKYLNSPQINKIDKCQSSHCVSVSQNLNNLSMSSKRSTLDDKKNKAFNQKLSQYNNLLKKLEKHSQIISQLKKINGQNYQRKVKQLYQTNQNCNISTDFMTSRNLKQNKSKLTPHMTQTCYESSKQINRSTVKEFSTQPIQNYRLFRSISVNNDLKINMINSFIQQKKSYEKKIIQVFILGKTLGEGAFGKVILVKHKQTNALFCLKIIEKQKVTKAKLIHQIILEIKIHKDLKQKNIVSLYGIFHDQKNIYLILQYLQGCSLFSYLKQHKKLQQDFVKDKIFQIAEGLAYLHAKNIVHRDIKPQNIILTNEVCKICDFGWSSYCDQRRKTTCGTLDYSAPQIVNGTQYDLSIDLWCLGVLTYQLLYGKPPFYHLSRKKTLEKILDLNTQNQNIQFPCQIKVSNIAKDFIRKLLRHQGSLRMTIQEALNHQFLKGQGKQRI